MNVEKLFLALSDIQPEKIEAAYAYDLSAGYETSKSSHILHKKYLKIAACVFLIVVLGGVFRYSSLMNSDETTATGSAGISRESEAAYDEEESVEVQNEDSYSEAASTDDSEEYQTVTYNDIEYSYTGTIVDAADIDQYLGNGIAYRVSDGDGDGAEESDCAIYAVVNMDHSEYIAVKIDNTYYLFTRSGD